jgi:hypothetical protein
MVDKAGFIMAFLARHLGMARCLPRVYIGVHLVAEAAEGGGFGKTEQRDGDDEKEDDADNEGNLHPLGMSLGNLLYRSKNIKPKGLG